MPWIERKKNSTCVWCVLYVLFFTLPFFTCDYESAQFFASCVTHYTCKCQEHIGKFTSLWAHVGTPVRWPMNVCVRFTLVVKLLYQPNNCRIHERVRANKWSKAMTIVDSILKLWHNSMKWNDYKTTKPIHSNTLNNCYGNMKMLPTHYNELLLEGN